MAKRLFDLTAALIGLLLASPVLVAAMFLVWLEDKHSPIYLAPRVGKDGAPFQMVKLRSMVANADRMGSSSTPSSDKRITRVGHIIRKFKLDELTQLWNVLVGDMSLVGPRPQVRDAVDVYTASERVLLSARPGITDFSSIVFSDEGSILKDHADPDVAYNQLIRPGKGGLGLFYIANRTLWLDVRLCWLTAVAIVSRPVALAMLQCILKALGADHELLTIAARQQPLVPKAPPGTTRLVTSRDGNPFC